MSEGKIIDFEIEHDCLTNAISFEEAMGITPTVTMIDLSSDVAGAKIEISEQAEYNQENGTSFSWDYVANKDLIKIEDFETKDFEIELDEPEAGVSSEIIWKFTILDLLDELQLYQERIPLERIAEKTAPSSLVNSFENRDPRLGALSQIKSD